MSYNTDLQSNNTDLEGILASVRNLPSAGGGADPICICDITTTEECNEIGVSEYNGNPIANLNKHHLYVSVSIPADSTQTNTNGLVWLYPKGTKGNNSIRLTLNIAAWKTTERIITYRCYLFANLCGWGDNYNAVSGAVPECIEGVCAYINATTDHFPIGTRIIAYVD